jgi:hypothetical protein
MAKNQEQALLSETAAHVLERGDIYFAYRPKIEAQVARGFEDVARLYMILSPHVKRSYRLIIVGEKHLPAVSGRRGSVFPFPCEKTLKQEQRCRDAVILVRSGRNSGSSVTRSQAPPAPATRTVSA